MVATLLLLVALLVAPVVTSSANKTSRTGKREENDGAVMLAEQG